MYIRYVNFSFAQRFCENDKGVGVHMKKLEPEWVQEFLRKRGREITLEEATIIYEFLRKLAKIAVSQYLSR